MKGKDMKILLVNKFLYPRGGAETYILKVGKQLEKMGHEVQYFGMYDAKNFVGNQYGLYTSNMELHNWSLSAITYPIHIIYSLDAKEKIKELIRKYKPDIVHLNNINFHLTPSIIEGAKECGVKIVQTVHDLQMLCPNHLMLSTDLKICSKCMDGNYMHCIKESCIHGSRIKSICGAIEASLYKKRNTYSLIDKFICPSHFMESMLTQKDIYKTKTIAIPNFIDIDVPKAITNKEEYILYFGRLSEEKGIGMILELAKHLQTPIYIAGTGSMQKDCEQSDYVKYLGFKTGNELIELISKAKLTLYPSIWYENCPMSILESQSLGTPVIASDLGGIKELIRDGITGYTISEITPEKMYQKINELMKDDKKLNYMSQKCKEAKLINLEMYAYLLVREYEKVLKREVCY